MFDLATYDTSGRRRLAEAQGWKAEEWMRNHWRICDSDENVRGGISYPSAQSAWTYCPIPDPLRSDADAWRLLEWLAPNLNGVEFEINVATELGEVFTWPSDGSAMCRKHEGESFKEALVSAALAWLSAKKGAAT